MGWERLQWVGVEGSGRGEGEEGRGKVSQVRLQLLLSHHPPHPYLPASTRPDPTRPQLNKSIQTTTTTKIGSIHARERVRALREEGLTFMLWAWNLEWDVGDRGCARESWGWVEEGGELRGIRRGWGVVGRLRIGGLGGGERG